MVTLWNAPRDPAFAMGNANDSSTNHYASQILHNRYKLVKELGRGGFTVAYEALDLWPPRSRDARVVVKILWNALPLYEEYFNREIHFHQRYGGYTEVPVKTAAYVDRFYDADLQAPCFVQVAVNPSAQCNQAFEGGLQCFAPLTATKRSV